MARATRSSTQHEKLSQDTHQPAHRTKQPQPAQPTSKKRKRHSAADIESQPATKQPRTDQEVKDELIDHVPESSLIPVTPKLQYAGDAPIDTEHAHKILDVLEMCVF